MSNVYSLGQVRSIRRARKGLYRLANLLQSNDISIMGLPDAEDLRRKELQLLRGSVQQMSVDEILQSARYINTVVKHS